MPGVARTLDGRISMKGGQPTQSTVQLGGAAVSDPATGDVGFELPVDAVEQVEVLSNPFAAEYGRFSTGVTRVETYSGTNRWHVTPNNFIPEPRYRRGEWWVIEGIRSFSPRLAVGGPLVKDRLFLEQSLQARLVETENQSLPQSERVRLRSLDTFTRVDAVLTPRHLATATLAVYPRDVDSVNLGTFVPQESTVDLVQQGLALGGTERTTLGSRVFVESGLSAKWYDVDLRARGDGPMTVAVEGLRDPFYNDQARRTRTVQWVESIAFARQSRLGEHVVKAGLDLLVSSYDGESASRPVLVERADGTRAERLDFTPATTQSVSATDAAAFVQDAWRINDRSMLGLGLRLDRDGVLDQWNASPRIGGAFALMSDARLVLRGGVGRFVERTPLNVGAFGSFERRTSTRYAEDGTTPVESIGPFAHVVAPGERAARGTTWNLELDSRLGRVVVPQGRPTGTPGITRADPRHRRGHPGPGRADGWPVTIRGDGSDPAVRGHERTAVHGHLRPLAIARRPQSLRRFFGNRRQPLVRPNEYGRAGIDVPHRLVIRGNVPLVRRWSATPIIEIRSGFPYSSLNEEQEFVGPRNEAGRYPRLATVDLDLTRPLRAWKWNIDVGVRFYNLLNAHAPREVQSNVDSPRYGWFFNPIPREVRLILRIRR